MADHYKILRIKPDATYAEIKKAYKNLIRRYHPDKRKDRDTTEEAKRIITAFGVLSDNKKREAYDRLLQRGGGHKEEEKQKKKKEEEEEEGEEGEEEEEEEYGACRATRTGRYRNHNYFDEYRVYGEYDEEEEDVVYF